MKTPRRQSSAAFTMIEIAISLAVIGFALVAIIGVLPTGMNVQRQNREETIINQDAAVFASAIRNGARGMDDLTNYVYAITNYWTLYLAKPTVTNYVDEGSDGYDQYGSRITRGTPHPVSYPLTNGLRIIGLLSWPKYQPVFIAATGFGNFWSNHIVAYVRALSGPASEKPPQTNAEVRLDAFSYRMICENMQTASYDGNTPYGKQLANNLRDLRLTFRWPLSPKGVPGNNRQTFRTVVGGSVVRTNDPTDNTVPPWPLYFFEPKIFAHPPP